MLTEPQVGSLKENGYCLVEGTSSDGLVRTAEMLGTPRPSRPDGPIVDILTPRGKLDARSGTISAHFGMGAFPWHSDGAVDRDPPRYVLMRAESVNIRSATTDILDLYGLLSGHLFCKYGRLVCEIKTRRSSYLAPFVTQRNGTWCAKWDPIRMRALGKKATEFHQEVAQAEPSARQHWKNGDLLVIDNWRCLHRRSDAASDPLRVIQRIVVKDRTE